MEKLTTFFISALIFLASLFALGIANAQEDVPRKLNPENINVPEGYKVEVFAANLSVPTTAIFDGEDLLVAESGFNKTAKARILRIKPNGEVSVEVEKELLDPVNGLLLIDNTLYVSHKGKVSRLEGNNLRDVVTGLPSNGDHHNNNLVLGPDGKIYLGQGTTTNTAVVGEDNYIFGWLDKNPTVHEVPCKAVVLTGENFETDNPLTKRKDKALTGPYKPFGTPSREGEVVKGNSKCGGSILRFNPDGSELEVYAWGLRNPFGLEFDESGQLWANFHGADVRGSRPVYNDKDYLLRVEENAWYGWPDYFDGEGIENERFHVEAEKPGRFIWQEHPELSLPFTTYDSHEGSNGLAIGPESFGFNNSAFSAMFGTFAPVTTGRNIRPEGFRVARVDLETGEVLDFASNKLPGPSYINQTGGFDRPSDVLFSDDGSMYVVDWGASTVTEDGLVFKPQTGVVWRIYRDEQQALRPNGPIIVESAKYPTDQRLPLVRNVIQTYKEILPHVLVLLAIPTVVVAIGLSLAYKRR